MSFMALAGLATLGCHEASELPEADTVAGTGTTADASGQRACGSAQDCPTYGDACQITSCEAGTCTATPKAEGASCFAAGLSAGECETYRCDSAARCIVAPLTDGTLCGPDDACTRGTCAAGECTGTRTVTSCSDGNPCTTDSCDGEGCKHTPADIACDDGDPCTENDSCITGTCAGSQACNCTKDADCAGLDADLCDGTFKCMSGKCTNDPSTAVTCAKDPKASDCDIPVCDPATGKCTVDFEAGTACDDDIACTKNDACDADGNCVSGAATCEYKCTDEADDDGDKLVDCADTDCAGDAACSVAPECTNNEDCAAPESECQTVACMQGACVTSNLPEGTSVPDELRNCTSVACDANGVAVPAEDPTDSPIVANDCIVEASCAGSPLAATYVWAAAGSPCTDIFGEGVCGSGDLAGGCVQCLGPEHCPAQPNKCVQNTCEEFYCGTSPVPAADLPDPVGNCMKQSCDGLGVLQITFDETDVPTKWENDCQVNPTCDATDGLEFDFAEPGTFCIDLLLGEGVCGGGAKVGQCVQCNEDADCGAESECSMPMCMDGVCSNMAKQPADPSPGDCRTLECVDGSPTEVTDPSDVPAATACANYICDGEPPTVLVLPEPPGTPCGDGGACDESATCAEATSCSDGMQNGQETGVDCGGPCQPCGPKACIDVFDCAGGICFGGFCQDSLNNCNSGNMTDGTASGTATITFANGNFTYAPACLVVQQGTTVTFNGNFVNHPMQGGVVAGGVKSPAASGPFATVTNTGTSKAFTLTETGVFPYYCEPHGTIGMMGVIVVVSGGGT